MSKREAGAGSMKNMEEETYKNQGREKQGFRKTEEQIQARDGDEVPPLPSRQSALEKAEQEERRPTLQFI